MALFINEAQVRSLLPMADAIEDVEASFIARAQGKAFDIPRRRTRMPGGHLHILQGGAPELNLVGYKAYYLQPDKSRTSLLHLINRSEGYVEAVIESDGLSQIRTGAATGVAARAMARKDARVLGLFGSGRHAVTQLEAICAVRDVKEVKVFGRDAARLAAFCTMMEKRVGVPARPSASREETVRGSDMIVAMTRASEPVFDGRWIEPGQFIAATGSNALDRREIDLATVRRADVLAVDSREVSQGESGDLMPAYENGFLYWENVADLGELLIGRWPGRVNDEQVTLFESHGMALQDIYTGARILKRAREQGIGVELPY
jgi:ornithine cyclodeaminase/alanine dehydrogenase-like protein (mu-crystallin family)